MCTFTKFAGIFFIMAFCVCFVLLLITYSSSEQISENHLYTFSAATTEDFDFKVPVYTWACLNQKCVKQLAGNNQVSLNTCKMMCSEPSIWPKPQNLQITNKQSSPIDRNKIFFKFEENSGALLLNEAIALFKENPLFLKPGNSSGSFLNVTINLTDSNTSQIKLNTNESYHLKIENTLATISAENYFGARHALETLLQLIWYDEIGDELRILHDVDIIDYPAFPYRGVMIDTARNFFPLELIKKVVTGMAMSKLNVLHLHLTDSGSFPVVLPRVPQLAAFGAYEPHMVYTTKDIKDLVDFSLVRGVQVLLEVDAPSHVNAGWNGLNGKYVICGEDNFFNGHLNPENENALLVLEKIYADLLELSGKNDLFHIGSDEVNVTCWQRLAKGQPLKKFWAGYTNKMIQKLRTANKEKYPDHVIMWSSPLTESSELETLDFKVTVQHWLGNPSSILRKGHKVIYSTVGHWYLDCGFGPWKTNMASGVCDPYTSWQEFYKYRPWVLNGYKELALGGEVCLWSEEVEVDTLETRIWPRSAAFAERVWSDLDKVDNYDVSSRLVTFSERLKSRGLKVAGIWPRWCSQNPGKC